MHLLKNGPFLANAKLFEREGQRQGETESTEEKVANPRFQKKRFHPFPLGGLYG